MESLLKLLADGRFHSGEELGAALGVSRAAVWKKLKVLSDMGMDLDAVRGKGYRLPAAVELLNGDLILKDLPESLRRSVDLSLRVTTASTNDDVRSMAQSSLTWPVCISEHQSNGRGRRGRIWQSPFGAALCFSMVWKIEGGLAAMEGLSLAVGLTVLKTLEGLGVAGLRLKWPNDVLADGKKMAGVLLEINGDPTGACEVVIGIGINLALSHHQKMNIDQPVTDVKSVAGKVVSKNRLSGLLIENLTTMLGTFKDYGFTPFRKQWQEYDAYAGTEVMLHTGVKGSTGIAVGVNDSGAVLLKTSDGIKAYSGGEISLRKHEYS